MSGLALHTTRRQRYIYIKKTKKRTVKPEGEDREYGTFIFFCQFPWKIVVSFEKKKVFIVATV